MVQGINLGFQGYYFGVVSRYLGPSELDVKLAAYTPLLETKWTQVLPK